jgi:signal transduction histidine kinase
VIRCRTAGEGEMVIEVEDQGIGIATGDLRDIFEEFVQVGKIQEGGTGLGLAISRRLVRLLDGRLEVESELGVGSTFRLILPSEAARLTVPQEQI